LKSPYHGLEFYSLELPCIGVVPLVIDISLPFPQVYSLKFPSTGVKVASGDGFGGSFKTRISR